MCALGSCSQYVSILNMCACVSASDTDAAHGLSLSLNMRANMVRYGLVVVTGILLLKNAAESRSYILFFSSNTKNKCRRIALFIRNWRGMSANAALQKYQMLNRFHSISSTFIRKSETMNYSFKHENAGVNYDHIFT